MSEKKVQKLSLQKRWIEAMNRINISLIGEGLSVKAAVIVCRGCRMHPPNKISLKTVKALEVEASQVAPIPNNIRELIEGEELIARKHTLTPPIAEIPQPKERTKRMLTANRDDYLEPWCKVVKDGKVVRYEDARGCAIPEMLWPERKG